MTPEQESLYAEALAALFTGRLEIRLFAGMAPSAPAIPHVVAHFTRGASVPRLVRTDGELAAALRDDIADYLHAMVEPPAKKTCAVVNLLRGL